MMDIWQDTKLLLFLLFFVPGFISVKVYDLLVPSERRDFSKSVFEVVGYSALNFAALSWLIITLVSSVPLFSNAYIFTLSVLLILFFFPIVWPMLFVKLQSWPPTAAYFRHPIQKPWDYVFGLKKPFWMIVHLKDGRRVGGRFYVNSFASSYPAEEQIYLEEVWNLDEDGKFVECVPQTRGLLIPGREIMLIELFEG